MSIAEPDEIPPAAITDLSALDPDGTHVTLQWTAPGDDGMIGMVSRYEVRYSISPIDEGNFSSAILAPFVTGTASMNAMIPPTREMAGS
jgi:hypothetical protein